MGWRLGNDCREMAMKVLGKATCKKTGRVWAWGVVGGRVVVVRVV